MTQIIAHNVIMAHHNFELPIEIYSDTSDNKLGAAINQNNRPIAFFSRKLNNAKMQYTITGKSFLR